MSFSHLNSTLDQPRVDLLLVKREEGEVVKVQHLPVRRPVLDTFHSTLGYFAIHFSFTFINPLLPFFPCHYYVPNLFLVVGQHDHVAHPVLEGHSPEVQHCVLFRTLNNEDFKSIQFRKKCDCVLFRTLNKEDFEGIQPKTSAMTPKISRY